MKKEFFVAAGSSFAVITPQIIANNLGVIAPGYQPTQAFYQVLVNKLASNGRLLVFAPGGGGLPQNYQRFSERAAEQGYHVVALHYWNDKEDTSTAKCKQYLHSASPSYDSCITDLYEGLFRNLNALNTALQPQTTANFGLTVGDPLQNRLRRLLEFLSVKFPDDGWAQFAPGGDAANYDQQPFIAWDKVTLAGFSNGSKLMAHIAQQVAVHRLIMLSGPNVVYTDESGKKYCPSSIGVIGATAVDRYFAYQSAFDDRADDAGRCYKAMGLYAHPFGKASSIYDDDYVKAGAHVLVDTVPALNACADNNHQSTAPDCALEPVTGAAILPSVRQTFDVWDYLLGRGIE